MTIETKTNRVQYVGNGVTTEFPVPFPVLQPDHLRLFLWQNNRQTEMTGGFSVVGAGTSSVSVRTTAPIAVGTRLTILREVPLKQEMDLLNGGDFNAEILEGSADNLEMQIQQLDEKVGRAIVAPESMGSNEVTYETLTDLKEDAEAAAAASASYAGRAKNSADLADAMVQEITNLQAAASSLAPEAEATANYDPVTGLLSLGIPKGDPGDPGRDGSGVNILGVFDNVSKLPAGDLGDAYMVGEDLYIWDVSGSRWVNAGPIRGPKGEKGDVGNQGDTGPQGDGAVAGELRLFPFRTYRIPTGWYVANGDRYALTSAQGQVLRGLDAEYKYDWGITEVSGTINLPSLFYSDGRGFFLRASSATYKGHQNVQTDAMERITGMFATSGYLQYVAGAFTGYDFLKSVSGVANITSSSGVYFDSSLVARTATETRPLSIGMTPAVYLGV